jgi:hypothetical protein
MHIKRPWECDIRCITRSPSRSEEATMLAVHRVNQPTTTANRPERASHGAATDSAALPARDESCFTPPLVDGAVRELHERLCPRSDCWWG